MKLEGILKVMGKVFIQPRIRFNEVKNELDIDNIGGFSNFLSFEV